MVPGVRSVIFRIFSGEINRKTAGPAAGIRHRARVAGPDRVFRNIPRGPGTQGAQGPWSPGVPGPWSPGVPGPWSPGVPEPRRPRAQGPWSPCVPGPYPGTPKGGGKKNQLFEVAVFAIFFFRDFPIRQNQVSQIFTPLSSLILIFQAGLGFLTFRVIWEDLF